MENVNKTMAADMAPDMAHVCLANRLKAWELLSLLLGCTVLVLHNASSVQLSSKWSPRQKKRAGEREEQRRLCWRRHSDSHQQV